MGAEIDAELAAALMRGRPGHREGLSADEREEPRIVPWLGGTLRFRVLNAVEVSWEYGKARLPYRDAVFLLSDEPSAAGTVPMSVREYFTWELLRTVSIGLRW
jgi:hypothetical protein